MTRERSDRPVFRRISPSQCTRRFVQYQRKETSLSLGLINSRALFDLSMRELTTCKIHSYFVTKLGTSCSIEKRSGLENMLVKVDEVDSRIVCVLEVQLITQTFRRAWFRCNCNARKPYSKFTVILLCDFLYI